MRYRVSFIAHTVGRRPSPTSVRTMGLDNQDSRMTSRRLVRRAVTATAGLALLAGTSVACSSGGDPTANAQPAKASPTSSAADPASASASGEPSAPPSATEELNLPVPPGRIAFRRYSVGSDSDGTLFSSATDGSDERLLVEAAAGESLEEPDWAPGGGVLFTRYQDVGTEGELNRLVLLDPDKTDLQVLTSGEPATETSRDLAKRGVFSPDGRHIAFQHDGGDVKEYADGSGSQLQHVDIWISDADGSHARNLTKGPAYSGDRDGVAWSPDGTRLVFSLWVAGHGTPAGGLALFVINADGTGLRRLTPWELGAGGPPDWSSDDLIGFRAVEDEESGVGNIFTIRPDGSELTQLTHFTDTVVSHKVSFSPDGRWIAFGRSGTGGANDIYIASIDGKHVQPVTQTPEEEGSPDWGPDA